jgi:hypothetical protein
MEIKIMKKLTHVILTPFIIFAAQTSSAALIELTFDDIPGFTSDKTLGLGQDLYGIMPVYKGFKFSSNLYWIDVVGSKWNYGAVSGDFALSNQASGIGIIIESTTVDFRFGGLSAKVYETPPEPSDSDEKFSGFLRGFKDNTEVWKIAADLTASYKFFGPQAGLIDKLKIDFGRSNLFLVDDITLSTAAVPVPAAAWLFGSGLIGLLSLARRRAKA